jgi:Plasmid encoded RepA protein
MPRAGRGDKAATTPAMTPAVQKLLNEALAIEAEEAQQADALGFMARALVQATLPHKRAEGSEFERRNGAFRLSLLAPSSVGLPYGSVPRLLLAWMTTEAVRTKNRELVLGETLSSFMGELGLVPTGGRWGSITRLKDQTRRLFSSTVTAIYEDREKTGILGYRLADQATLWWDAKRPEQAALWRSTVMLTEPFFREITERPVPIDMRALKALKRSPLALDLYCWLTYRLSYLGKPTEIPWIALAAQFGADYGRLRDFKSAFLAEMRKMLVVYPQAHVAPGEHGLRLAPSPTHVRALARRAG